MDSESHHEMIPCLDFSKDMLVLKEGSEEWKEMSKKVRESCENYGSFMLMCDKIPEGLCEDMLMGMKELFDLPEETKMKYSFSKTYTGYNSDSLENPCQSFAIDNVHVEDAAQAFTNLMWPQQNHAFSETLKSITSKMYEMSFFILKMIQESYELPKEYTSNIEKMKSASNFRIMKYIVPENYKDGEVLGLLPHTDKSAITIVFQNQVQGLEVLTKTNQWIQLSLPKQGFVVFVGDALKAWSNGRLHSVTHRVMISGDKDRYSFGLFAMPKVDMKIEVPSELVDDKIHPLRYRSFKYGDYLQHFFSAPKENALDVFAGI